MLFIIFFAVISMVITFLAFAICWKEIIAPLLFSCLFGILAAVFGFLILVVVVNIGMNTVLDSQTFEIVPINIDKQIVYYIDESNSIDQYILILNEEGELTKHETSYKHLHFLKENEKAYAIRDQVGFKSEFWNHIFASKYPYYEYQYYIPVT